MIVSHPIQPSRRRSAFTLLEVLVVVAIILVLASVATVAVLQLQKENKDDIALLKSKTLYTALKTYIVRNDGNPPQNIQDIARYVEGTDPNKLNDPWGAPFQIGSMQNNEGVTTYYIFTTSPEGLEIRSDLSKVQR